MRNSNSNRLDKPAREPLAAIPARIKAKTRKRISRLTEEVEKLSETLDRTAARKAKISKKI
jgi:DNA anti-recombination protein RmuC